MKKKKVYLFTVVLIAVALLVIVVLPELAFLQRADMSVTTADGERWLNEWDARFEGDGDIYFLDYHAYVDSREVWAEDTPGKIRIGLSGPANCVSELISSPYICVFRDGTCIIETCGDKDNAIFEAKGWCSSQKLSSWDDWYCLGKLRVTYYVSEEDIGFEKVSGIQTYYFRGENVTIEYKVTNNFPGPLTSAATLHACIPALTGVYCEDYTQEAMLNEGDNIIQFEIPTSLVTSELTLKPIINIKTENFFTSVDPYFIRLAPTVYEVFRFEGNETKAMIMPRPIYIEKGFGGCPEGYEESPNGVYCIDSGIKNLGCLQLGCPEVAGHNYTCTSSGDCAETIFYPQTCEGNESLCPDDFTCDLSSGACVKTELIEVLKQCDTASDCMVPCPGMHVSCINNFCDYSGSCEEIYVYYNDTKVIYNQTYVGCREIGCPDTYECNTDRNVCERTITTTPKLLYNVLYGLLAAIVILILVLLYKTRWKK